MQSNPQDFFNVQSQQEQRITIQGDTLDDSDIYLYNKFIKKMTPEKKDKNHINVEIPSQIKTHHKRLSTNIPRIFIDNQLAEHRKELNREEKIRKAKQLFEHIGPIKRRSSRTIEFRMSLDGQAFQKLKEQKSQKTFKKKKSKKSEKTKENKLQVLENRSERKKQTRRLKKVDKSSKKVIKDDKKVSKKNRLTVKSQNPASKCVQSVKQKSKIKIKQQKEKIDDKQVMQYCQSMNKNHFQKLIQFSIEELSEKNQSESKKLYRLDTLQSNDQSKSKASGILDFNSIQQGLQNLKSELEHNCDQES